MDAWLIYARRIPHTLTLIEELGHPELLQWIIWMRSRRNNEAVNFVRQGGYLDKSERSIYPQGRRKGGFVARSNT